MTDVPAALTLELDDDVAVVTLDDGKANALTAAVLGRLDEVLDEVADARALVIIGRPGRFSGGFDLSVMSQGIEAAKALVGQGGKLLMRLYGFPRPVVAGCTGHAVAGGALTLLTCDTRIGAEGDFKIGLNETAIGMALPTFALELVRSRVAPTHFTRSAVQAEFYDPAGAVDAGYLDRVVAADDVVAEAVAEGRRLGALHPGAYAANKSAMRRSIMERAVASIETDLLAAGAG